MVKMDQAQRNPCLTVRIVAAAFAPLLSTSKILPAIAADKMNVGRLPELVPVEMSQLGKIETRRRSPDLREAPADATHWPIEVAA